MLDGERLREIARNCRYVASKADVRYIAEALLELAQECEWEAAEAENAMLPALPL